MEVKTHWSRQRCSHLTTDPQKNIYIHLQKYKNFKNINQLYKHFVDPIK